MSNSGSNLVISTLIQKNIFDRSCNIYRSYFLAKFLFGQDTEGYNIIYLAESTAPIPFDLLLLLSVQISGRAFPLNVNNGLGGTSCRFKSNIMDPSASLENMIRVLRLQPAGESIGSVPVPAFLMISMEVTSDQTRSNRRSKSLRDMGFIIFRVVISSLSTLRCQHLQ